MFDPHQFWEENANCLGKPFHTDKPRAGLTLGFDEHWLFEEMAVESTVRYYRDDGYRQTINRECNDRCESVIGLRPFPEQIGKPGPKRIELLFGSHEVLTEGGTPWLEPGHETTDSFSTTLDRLGGASSTDILDLAFEGVKRGPSLSGTYTVWSRGPITAGCSVLGPERFLEWLIDEPALMHRYFDVFVHVLTVYHRGLAGEAQIVGVCWLDDFCCLLSPTLYERFVLPAMLRIMDDLAPDGYRFQHSDSAMGHLLPMLAQMRLNAVNLGPTLTVREIRGILPKTEIHGHIAPFLLRNGNLADVERKLIADFDEVGRDGGLVVTTAGSVAAGTTLDRIRALMQMVESRCRYDPAEEQPYAGSPK